MVGHFVLTLAPEQEDRVLTGMMRPGSYRLRGDLGPCLVLRLAPPRFGDADEHVRRADLMRALELLDVRVVELLDLRVRRRRLVILPAQRHVLHAPSVGLAELVGVLSEIRGKLLIGGAGGGDDRRQLDQGPRGTHLFAPETELLLELGL